MTRRLLALFCLAACAAPKAPNEREEPPVVIDPRMPSRASTATKEPLTLKQRVDAYERGLVVEAVRQANGNVSQAARDLGISRVTLHDKLKKYQ